ncbi:glycosyl hydrolase family 39 [Acidisarcina polymorpha]|nr:glycosyl hydrolase family 39 [Acidisarcina polymorpha]
MQIAQQRKQNTSLLMALAAVCFSGVIANAQTPTAADTISVDWGKTISVSKSTPTLQVVVNPMLRQGSPIHDGSFQALKDLGADYVRYVPWEPYPKLAVAELDAPTKDKTSWDFSLIDPMTKDFLNATDGHSTIMNFSTIPAWLFKTEKPVVYPADPDQVFWTYTQGTELNDPSGKEVGDYFARLVSWYTKGGFTDENGKRHTSGYHYSFPYWEVLNEVDFEHSTTPESYTQRYDAIVSAIHAVSPDTKFVGLALAQPSNDPKWFEYFLDPRHHKPGIPLDYVSYHFYATPSLDQDINDWQYTFFDQADRFLATTRYIEAIRKRLTPETKTDTDELGIILPTDGLEIAASKALPNRIPSAYWAGAGALYAYLYIELAKMGIDVIGESQLVGYPSQFPSVSMMDWTNGKPNARYWVLKLIKDNLHPGDKLVETKLGQDSTDISAQGFVTPSGKKLLLINKLNRSLDVHLPAGTQSVTLATVDEASGDGPARTSSQNGDALKVSPFSVTLVSWP